MSSNASDEVRRGRSSPLHRVWHGKSIASQQIDVLVYQRRKSGDVFGQHRKALSTVLLESRINVERVPENDPVC